MLRIYYGELNDEKYISVPDIFFDNTYEDYWITDELSVEMIKDVDKSDVVGPHLIDSPFLGPISPERLSGGVCAGIEVSARCGAGGPSAAAHRTAGSPAAEQACG